jgi:hypothetical protein
MTGYTMDELRGRSLRILQGPETDPEVLARLRACLREARFFEGIAINYRKDGSTYGHLEKPHLAAPSLKSHRPDTFPSTPDEIA